MGLTEVSWFLRTLLVIISCILLGFWFLFHFEAEPWPPLPRPNFVPVVDNFPEVLTPQRGSENMSGGEIKVEVEKGVAYVRFHKKLNIRFDLSKIGHYLFLI